MGTPFFSIIIPTFNSSGHISNCLHKLSNQSFRNFEVIIVDGKSTDDTLQIVTNIAAQTQLNIQVNSEPDHGIYDAMNKGIEKANGTWLYFLGSDDYLFDEEVLKNVHHKLNRKNCHVAYGNVKVIGQNRWAKDGELYAGRFRLYDILRKNICHQSIFYRRSFINGYNLRYDLTYPISADWDLNLRCWGFTGFYYMNLAIACFQSTGFSSLHVTDNYGKIISEKFPYWKGRYRTNVWADKVVRALIPIKQLIKKVGL